MRAPCDSTGTKRNYRTGHDGELKTTVWAVVGDTQGAAQDLGSAVVS